MPKKEPNQSSNQSEQAQKSEQAEKSEQAQPSELSQYGGKTSTQSALEELLRRLLSGEPLPSIPFSFKEAAGFTPEQKNLMQAINDRLAGWSESLTRAAKPASDRSASPSRIAPTLCSP